MNPSFSQKCNALVLAAKVIGDDLGLTFKEILRVPDKRCLVFTLTRGDRGHSRVCELQVDQAFLQGSVDISLDAVSSLRKYAKNTLRSFGAKHE